MSAKENFLNHAQKPVQTSEGPMDFPILYRDIGGFTALFRVETARLAKQLAGTGFVPALGLPGGKSIVGVAFFEYRDCTIATYNEASVATTVIPESRIGQLRALEAFDFLKPKSSRDVGIYITQLPVTTEQARAGGVEVYGYPKFVADIDFHLDGNAFTGVTRENKTGKEIVRLEGSARFGVPVPGMDVQTWSFLGASLLKTQIKMDSMLRVSPGRGFTLRVGPSKHPMAKQLRELGLDGAAPFLVARGDSYRSVLPLGEVVG